MNRIARDPHVLPSVSSVLILAVPPDLSMAGPESLLTASDAYCEVNSVVKAGYSYSQFLPISSCFMTQGRAVPARRTSSKPTNHCLQGDTLRSWRNEPFVMVEGGPRWIPPSMIALGQGSQQTAAQRGGEAKEKDKPMSDLQRDRCLPSCSPTLVDALH